MLSSTKFEILPKFTNFLEYPSYILDTEKLNEYPLNLNFLRYRRMLVWRFWTLWKYYIANFIRFNYQFFHIPNFIVLFFMHACSLVLQFFLLLLLGNMLRTKKKNANDLERIYRFHYCEPLSIIFLYWALMVSCERFIILGFLWLWIHP